MHDPVESIHLHPYCWLGGMFLAFSVLSTVAWTFFDSSPDKLVRPNILVISLCSVRPDHMSAYGYQRQTTPTFEKLARESLVFESAITQWPKTTPAFATLMTGKYGHHTGVMRITPGQRLGDEHQTLAEVLRSHGYATGAFVSSSAVNEATNIFQQGFDVVEETFRDPDMFASTTRKALSWLDQPRAKPFFLWVHYNNAHQPYFAPGAPAGLFIDDEFYDSTRRISINDGKPLPLDVPQDHPFHMQILRSDIGGARPDTALKERPEEYAFYIARYDAGIFGADRMAGELLAGLQRRGLYDDTLIVVVGDHGEALGDHDYYFGHGRLPYDDCARVAFMIRRPGAVGPRRVATPVPTFSLAPTLLEMAGATAPPEMEAPSLVPVLRGKTGPSYVFTESGYQLNYTLAVRNDRWKLIFVPNTIDRSLMTGSEYELYEWRNDRYELRNLYDETSATASGLSRALRRWAHPWIRSAYRAPTKQNPLPDREALHSLRSLGYIAPSDDQP